MFTNPNWAHSVKQFEQASEPEVYAVSPCCQAEIRASVFIEKPLGEREYNGHGIRNHYDACVECGKEVMEPALECVICGEIDCLNECEEG